MSAENNLAIVGGKEYSINTQSQNGAPADLGKRFVCGVQLERQEVGGADGKIIKKIVYASGDLTLVGGDKINVGCGTEFLVTKSSPNIIECCGKPAVLKKPEPLPSSD